MESVKHCAKELGFKMFAECGTGTVLNWFTFQHPNGNTIHLRRKPNTKTDYDTIIGRLQKASGSRMPAEAYHPGPVQRLIHRILLGGYVSGVNATWRSVELLERYDETLGEDALRFRALRKFRKLQLRTLGVFVED